MRGVAPSAVTKAVKAGRITLVGNKIDPALADHQWAANSRTRQDSMPSEIASPSEPARTEDYYTSRARRESAEADLAELKLAEQRGELVRADEVRASLSRVVAGLREALLQLPARLVPVLSAEPEPARMHEVLHAEIVRALSQISGTEEANGRA